MTKPHPPSCVDFRVGLVVPGKDPASLSAHCTAHASIFKECAHSANPKPNGGNWRNGHIVDTVHWQPQTTDVDWKNLRKRETAVRIRLPVKSTLRQRRRCARSFSATSSFKLHGQSAPSSARCIQPQPALGLSSDKRGCLHALASAHVRPFKKRVYLGNHSIPEWVP